ncbi:MASE1 domain-containing protein [Streptomyces zhihengii]|uniref:MASE1 domain-containing protein n=1 Tax=Streptomyces zhihengii TaxID=1818004 RepID=UPI0027DC9E96|nr:MASE1 domain-containing protein [Streptomyces zhihengii]
MRALTSREAGLVLLRIAAMAALYYGAAELGLQQQLVRGQVTPLWPPTGVAVAGLLAVGPRVWPGIALGAFLANVSLGPSIPAVLLIVAGNTLAPVCAYLLLRRAGFRTELDRLRDVPALVFLGALGGMLVSATVGSAVLLVSGAIDGSDFWPTWSVWWTGDAMGVLVVTPFLLMLRRVRRPVGAGWPRWAEAAALAAGTVLVTHLATRTSNASLLFLVFPFLIWAAYRFRQPGAATCTLAVSTLAILAAAGGSGPFAGHDLFSNMVTLQAFNGTAALTALLLAAVVTERDETHQEIKRLCSRLAEVVAQIEPRPEAYGRTGYEPGYEAGDSVADGSGAEPPAGAEGESGAGAVRSPGGPDRHERRASYGRAADAEGAGFREAGLRDADLRDADAAGAEVRGAEVRGAEVRSTEARGTDVSRTDVSGTEARRDDES